MSLFNRIASQKLSVLLQNKEKTKFFPWQKGQTVFAIWKRNTKEREAFPKTLTE
jgi:hypothetical protein